MENKEELEQKLQQRYMCQGMDSFTALCCEKIETKEIHERVFFK